MPSPRPHAASATLWLVPLEHVQADEQMPSEQFTTASAGALSLLTSAGGVIGYVRTGSIPSIAAGLSVGALYLLSLFRLQNGQPYGEEIGLVASTVLGGSAIPRAIKTRGKPVPVGLSLLATYGLVVFGLAYRDRRAARV
ncbi:hypothetical protein VTN00DRAFT_513 [Thermoascus crustaceus]|uniref:uncharacterized protein n=1 Tax=Thermoascus crustaceus TaxID=5088 RepID=UPI0037438D7F